MKVNWHELTPQEKKAGTCAKDRPDMGDPRGPEQLSTLSELNVALWTRF
jgi:hypothetical protein